MNRFRVLVSGAALAGALAGDAAGQARPSVGDLLNRPSATSSPSALPDAVRRALNEGNPYDDGAALGSAPSLQDGPIDPETYYLGPGDELMIYYRGKTSLAQRVPVTPEGKVYLPDAGSLDVGGWVLADARRKITEKVGKMLRDVSVDVHLTRIRTFKVTVGGEVMHPGVYAANGTTRVFELLRIAGGIRDSAAIRDVRLIGVDDYQSSSVDLLPFLLGAAGKTNPLVREGYTVFVPRRSGVVTVLGAVRYPGTYDLPREPSTFGELLALLGVRADAMAGRMEFALHGVPARSTTVIDIAREPLVDGATLLIPGRSDYHESVTAAIDGEVAYPGPYAITAETTLRDLITRAGGFTDKAVPARVRLVRPVEGDTLATPVARLAPFGSVTLTATEREILRSRGVSGYRAVVVNLEKESENGPNLEPGDRIFVPRNGGFVEVAGRVKEPGFYPYMEGWSARDYVSRAGGYASRADKGQTRVGGGPGDNFRVAKDAGAPEPGDQVWVPEKIPRGTFDIARDTFLILAQVATIIIVIDQVSSSN